jgi:AcrR family transcriptional regulator
MSIVSYQVVDNISAKRKPGRPLAFDPDVALDAAVLVFWRNGYAGADTETLASAMGITKPSIYGTFGSKEQLFMKALDRYAATVGSQSLEALAAAPTIQDGVLAFFDVTIENVSGRYGASGCLMSCVAAQCASTMPEVAAFLREGLAATDAAIAQQFKSSIADGSLRSDFPAHDRACLMTDLMQALSLRARAGFTQSELARALDTGIVSVLA